MFLDTLTLWHRKSLSLKQQYAHSYCPDIYCMCWKPIASSLKFILSLLIKNTDKLTLITTISCITQLNPSPGTLLLQIGEVGRKIKEKASKGPQNTVSRSNESRRIDESEGGGRGGKIFHFSALC